MPVELSISEFTDEELKEFQIFLGADLKRKPGPLVQRMKDIVDEEVAKRHRSSPPRLCHKGCGLKEPR
jgi:hypothetical protein